MVAEGYSVVDACRLVALARSSYYYSDKPEDEALENAVIQVAHEHVTYGTRRVTHQLRRCDEPIHINRKQVQRIMRKHALLRPVKRRKKRTTQSTHGFQRFPNLVEGVQASYPDQIWVADITYIRFRLSFIYLAAIMDVYTRMVRGWCVHPTLDQMLSLKALRQALIGGHPEIHHSDQGIHYAAPTYVALLHQHGVRVSMAAKGCPEENGYAERLMRTIKEEEVDLSEYDSFQDAREQLDDFFATVYNRKRIHSALGYQTPAEFEFAYRQAHAVPLSQA